jgi:hypothetical protein
VEDARTAHHAALREPDDLHSWPVSRNRHACSVDNRQAFFFWIGAGSAASNACDPEGETAGLLAGPAACSRSTLPASEPPKQLPLPPAEWRLSPSATFC